MRRISRMNPVSDSFFEKAAYQALTNEKMTHISSVNLYVNTYICIHNQELNMI